MPVPDGKLNKKYYFMDTTKAQYAGMITAFTSIQTNKEADNTLPIRLRLDGLESLVKVCGIPGWIEDSRGIVDAAIANGTIISENEFDDLQAINTVLNSPEWNEPLPPEV